MEITIKTIKAREVLDSRGVPTVEVDMFLSDGSKGSAISPSGASTGSFEAVELRDSESKRFFGKGVLKAIGNVNQNIKNEIEGKSFNQESLDQTLIKLDGTENKENLGANAILPVSIAFLKASAKSSNTVLYKKIEEISRTKIKMPTPMINILNGGSHANNGLDFQEFMIIPLGKISFSEKIRKSAEVFQTLKKILKSKNKSVAVGDEGGFAPDLSKNNDAMDLLLEAIEKSGLKPGKDMAISLDIAANEFYKNEKYNLNKENKIYNSDELLKVYKLLIKKYPIFSIEDPFQEEDWNGFKKITKEFGKEIKIIGDDLFVTNISRLERGLKEKSANGIIIKPNQIGTITETINVAKKSLENNFTTIISHRSGETEDNFISHLSVGLGTGFIKTGSLSRGERISKYNELLRIEENIK